MRERRSASKMGLACGCIMDRFRLQNSLRHKMVTRSAVDDEDGNIRESCLFLLLVSHVGHRESAFDRAIHPTFYFPSAWRQRFAISIAGYSWAGEVIR